MAKRWYVLHVFSGSEKKVAQSIREQSITHGLEDQIETLWARAVKSARSARDAHGSGRIAGSIGPLVASYRPDICPSPAKAEELYRDVVAALSPAGCQ